MRFVGENNRWLDFRSTKTNMELMLRLLTFCTVVLLATTDCYCGADAGPKPAPTPAKDTR